ncbi:7686_t:CDS:1, partial [Dentiscutata heterogama]
STNQLDSLINIPNLSELLDTIILSITSSILISSVSFSSLVDEEANNFSNILSSIVTFVQVNNKNSLNSFSIYVFNLLSSNFNNKNRMALPLNINNRDNSSPLGHINTLVLASAHSIVPTLLKTSDDLSSPINNRINKVDTL